MANKKRTTASRRRNTAPNRFMLFPGVGALAIAAFYAGGGTEAGVWLARLVLVAGGALVGVLAAQDKSRPRLAPALLAPLPVLAFAGLTMLGFTESNSDRQEAGRVLAITILLFDIPLAAAFKYTSGRRHETLIAAADPEVSARDRELDLATDHGRAVTVVREYREDEEGQGHLETDAKALESRGYQSVSIEHIRPGLAEVGLELVLGVDVSEAKIVATFRLRSAPGDGSPEQSPSSKIISVSSARFGCLSVALIVAWTIAGVAVMVAGFLALGALDPNQVEGNPIGGVPPLVGLVIAFFGSVLSIRWLWERG